MVAGEDNGLSRGDPPHRYRAVTLAGCADQPAQGVLRPARGDRPGTVVRLPQSGRIPESGLAPCHGAPGGGNLDLVANGAVPGNRDRMNQRIEARRALRRFTMTVSQGGRRLSHRASPAVRARPPCVLGKTSCGHRPPASLGAMTRAAQWKKEPVGGGGQGHARTGRGSFNCETPNTLSMLRSRDVLCLTSTALEVLPSPW
jgi:hypothetical protein